MDIFEKNSYESVPLKYEVIAHGIPKPEAVWYLKGEEIKADSRTTLINEGVILFQLCFNYYYLICIPFPPSLIKDIYRLERKELKLEDAGEYKVVIKNKCGEKTHQGVLSLSGK